MIIATGEASPNPSIHIWNIITLEPYKIIETNHKNGILHLAFSKDGEFLVSVGYDRYYSIQVTNWMSEEILVFRNTDAAPILDVTFHNYNRYEFVTVGYYNIAVWQIEGRSLSRKEWIHVKEDNRDQPPFFTCVSYLDHGVMPV